MLKAPFPWFGGKSQAAGLIWERLGEVNNYIEPFFGSGAVLLGRPHQPRVETVNDIDGALCNFWRAVTYDPIAVAEYASWPVNECDLHARHLWLVERLRDGFAERLMADSDFHDAKVAGWWVWGMAVWIGREFCSGNGPWSKGEDGKLSKNEGPGIQRQIPHLGNDGQGVNRPDLGTGVRTPGIVQSSLVDWFCDLAERLRWVRVCCGDWTRVLGPSVTYKHLACSQNGICGIVLDPPYAHSERDILYTHDFDVAADVRKWALAHGDIPNMRIAMCGFEGDGNEAFEAAGWPVVEWFRKTMLSGGYGNIGGTSQMHRERIWFSPHCLSPRSEAQFDLFAKADSGRG